MPLYNSSINKHKSFSKYSYVSFIKKQMRWIQGYGRRSPPPPFPFAGFLTSPPCTVYISAGNKKRRKNSPYHSSSFLHSPNSMCAKKQMLL